MSERPTALVTGASRGIGAVVAESLSGTHDLLLGGRDVAALEKLAARLPGARPWPVELTRLLLPALRAARGHVVLINSGAGLNANPHWGAYAASKFALRAYADVLRAEEDEHGLKVTSVHPGRTDTDMQRGVRTDEGGDYEPDRYLRPESVAQAVLTAVMAPPDAHFTEVVVRPGRR